MTVRESNPTPLTAPAKPAYKPGQAVHIRHKGTGANYDGFVTSSDTRTTSVRFHVQRMEIRRTFRTVSGVEYAGGPFVLIGAAAKQETGGYQVNNEPEVGPHIGDINPERTAVHRVMRPAPPFALGEAVAYFVGEDAAILAAEYAAFKNSQTGS